MSYRLETYHPVTGLCVWRNVSVSHDFFQNEKYKNMWNASSDWKGRYIEDARYKLWNAIKILKEGESKLSKADHTFLKRLEEKLSSANQAPDGTVCSYNGEYPFIINHGDGICCCSVCDIVSESSDEDTVSDDDTVSDNGDKSNKDVYNNSNDEGDINVDDNYANYNNKDNNASNKNEGENTLLINVLINDYY